MSKDSSPTVVADPTREATPAEEPEATSAASVEPSQPAGDEAVRLRGAWPLTIALAILVVASTAVAASLFYFQYLPDRETNDSAAKAAISAASDSTVAILSYAPESLDADFSNARSRLTGEFLTYYGKFTEQIVGPAAKQKQVKTTAAVAQAAVSELRSDSAVVLVFVNQTTQSAERPDPSITASSVLVRLTKVDGAWLVSQFNPI